MPTKMHFYALHLLRRFWATNLIKVKVKKEKELLNYKVRKKNT